MLRPVPQRKGLEDGQPTEMALCSGWKDCVLSFTSFVTDIEFLILL